MASGETAEPTVRRSAVAAVGTAITAVVHGALLLAFAVVLVYTVPLFREMFAEMRVELPVLTLLLIRLSDWFKHFWFLVFPLVAGALAVDALVFWFLASRRGAWLLGVLWSLGVAAVLACGIGCAVAALVGPLTLVMDNIGSGG